MSSKGGSTLWSKVTRDKTVKIEGLNKIVVVIRILRELELDPKGLNEIRIYTK